MSGPTIALTLMTLSIFLIFLGFLVWGWKSGQFKNVEDAKYIVFHDRDAEKPECTGETTPAAKPKR